MAGIKIIRDVSAIGSADIFGTAMSAVFWFYLASQIDPSSYGEIFWFLGIAGIFSTIATFGTINTITVLYCKKNSNSINTKFYLIISECNTIINCHSTFSIILYN